jgi:hypothetical protein
MQSYIDSSKRQLMDTSDFQSRFDLYNQEVGASPCVTSVKASCEEFFIEDFYPCPISQYSAMKYVYAIAALAKSENTKDSVILENLELMDKWQAR